MTEKKVVEQLNVVRQTLERVKCYHEAEELLFFDRETRCPKAGEERIGDAEVLMKNRAFREKKEPAFLSALDYLAGHMSDLNERERVLIKKLSLERQREKNITPEQQAGYEEIKVKAYSDWLKARKENDFGLFKDSLKKVRDAEMERVLSWDNEEDRPLSVYERMISEYERGLTEKRLDELFKEAKERIGALLLKIKSSRRMIRTDFLYRHVTDEQQREAVEYLLDLVRFDRERGAYGLTEHPFTTGITRNDTRVATCFYPNLFLSNVYSILHEAGHALFAQLIPKEDFDDCLWDNKTYGMDESVSRFYENVLGRSSGFIHLIYPRFREIFPQVFMDVSEKEFYEAVNLVTPSLIRTEADELTYTLHIIHRYEMEKLLIKGEVEIDDLPSIWNDKMEELLTVRPDCDRDGILQDVHWVDSFGYFPSYAIGNFYNAAFYRKMKEDMNVDEILARGDFAAINSWMTRNVFQKANVTEPEEWILGITGEPLSAEPFLSYLEEKYTDLYDLNRIGTIGKAELDRLLDHIQKIRELSSPQIASLTSAEEYADLLRSNFAYIAEMANKNREIIDSVINPALKSNQKPDRKLVEQLFELSQSLVDPYTTADTDVQMAFDINESIKCAARKSGDEELLIRCLDNEIVCRHYMNANVVYVEEANELSEKILAGGIEALKELLSFLEPEKFLKLSRESREIVMINSRYGITMLEKSRLVPVETAVWSLSLLEQSLKYCDDPFYRRMLPDYDWDYHKFRTLQYYSVLENTDLPREWNQLRIKRSREFYEYWRLDPKKHEEMLSFHHVKALYYMTLFYSGEITKKEYLQNLRTVIEEQRDDLKNSESMLDLNEMYAQYAIQARDYKMTKEEKDFLEEFYSDNFGITAALSRDGRSTNVLTANSAITKYFVEIPGGLTFRSAVLREISTLHPQTYIHSCMVARIAACLAKHMLNLMPEQFIGTMGCETAEDVKKNREELYRYAYQAALCHDFGKVFVMSTVSIYGRRLLDVEFDILCLHPEIGANRMEQYPSTADFSDVARGHHKWYDGTKGYPESFDIKKSPWKTMIYIVTVADCMDAATDSVGRNYKKGRSFPEFLEEVKEGAGKRYAPFFADLLSMEPVKKDLAYLLSTGRKKIYESTFKTLQDIYHQSENMLLNVKE